MKDFLRIGANVLLIPFQAFVHLKMWIWFLTPLGLGTPNKWLIFGLVMWIAHLSNYYVGDLSAGTEMDKWNRAVITPNMRLLFLWGFGFVYHWLALR